MYITEKQTLTIRNRLCKFLDKFFYMQMKRTATNYVHIKTAQ